MTENVATRGVALGAADSTLAAEAVSARDRSWWPPLTDTALGEDAKRADELPAVPGEGPATGSTPSTSQKTSCAGPRGARTYGALSPAATANHPPLMERLWRRRP